MNPSVVLGFWACHKSWTWWPISNGEHKGTLLLFTQLIPYFFLNFPMAVLEFSSELSHVWHSYWYLPSKNCYGENPKISSHSSLHQNSRNRLLILKTPKNNYRFLRMVRIGIENMIMFGDMKKFEPQIYPAAVFCGIGFLMVMGFWHWEFWGFSMGALGLSILG